jgi:Kef-type K+ transport system membrane component KefB
VKKANPTRSAQVRFAWGILLGMFAIPVIALFSKIWPQANVVWTVLFVCASLLVGRSLIGYLFPRAAKHADTLDAKPAH